MRTFEEINNERNALLDKIDGLLNAADNLLTEDQQKEVETHQAKVEELTNEANALQAAAAKAVELQQKQEKLRATRLNPIVNRLVKQGGNAPPSITGDTGFRLPAFVQRVNPTAFTASADDCDGRGAQERAYRFGQFALAIASKTGKFHFQNAINFCNDNGLLNVHGEGAGDVSGAGIFVPEEFSTDIIRLVETYGVIRREVGTTSMRSDTKKVPRRVGGVTAYFVGENGAGTESDATWNEVTLVAKKLMAMTRMSNELAEDSVIDIANQLLTEIALAYALKEDQCGFSGDGTSTYGGMMGIRSQLDTLTAGTAPGLILGAGNAYSELTLANFSSVAAALPEYPGVMPKWYCHKTFFYNVMQPLALAAGGTTAGDIVNGIAARFLGYPVVFSQVFPSTAANSQIPVIFGDLSMGCKFGDRRRYTVDFSTEATVGGQSMWERDQVGIRATERFDFNCHDFGSNTVAGPICGLELAAS